MTSALAELRPVAIRQPRCITAVAAWTQLLGQERVLAAHAAAQRYGVNTEALTRSLAAALLPETTAEVADIVRIAARHRVPVYPISTGRNWGYGSSLPVADGCAIVDLSRLNRIVACDAELGLVTVQPGVTQQQLADFLDERGLPFLVPVTGAGPDCSLLGNALERGYGLTPHADHFGALTSLEAVLPDGSVYRPALTELGGATVDRAFKWGLGPYLDGLFSQGNFGIVTEATIALARRPERVEGFFFTVRRAADLEAATAAVQDLLRTLGPVVGGINLMNARRVVAMLEPFPKEQVSPGSVMPPELVDALARRHGATAWLGVGALYGAAPIVAAARAIIRRRLKSVAGRLVFLTPEKASRIRRLLSWVPGLRSSRLYHRTERLEALLRHLAGRPSDIALPLAYWKSGRLPPPGGRHHPARDGCGLLWYAPLVPLRPAAVRSYVEMVERICPQHGMEPLITLTSLSERCFDSTVPLLFDRASADDAARAHACQRALLAAGQEAGFLPYRLGVHSMKEWIDPALPCWRFSSALKQAVDPHGILAPGRYGRP